MRYFLLGLLLSVSHAEAKRLHVNSGASRMDASEFFSCMESALNGRDDGECSYYGQAPECIGARLALEFGLLRSKCLYRDQGACRVYGHKERSQSQWMSTASGHIALVMECVRHRYGNEESNGRREALQDPQLLAFLRSVPDGSHHFGYKNGEILERSLSDERLSSILARSPVATDLGREELEQLKQAADNPIAIRDPDGKSGRGENLTQEGASFASAYKEAFADRPTTSPDLTPVEENASRPVLRPTLARTEKEKEPARKPATEKHVPDHIFAREYKENPYSLGLDRTLFDRVSLAYRRYSSDLRTMDMYIKTAKSRPPRDLSEALARGRAL